MELYEIVHWKSYLGRSDYGQTSVITATMDKDMAEKMLEIYRYNQSTDESYEIRTVRMSDPMKL